MQIEPLSIADVLLIRSVKHGDARGFFSEVFRVDVLAAHGINQPFVQDNHSLSGERGVLRGLHFQSQPHAQGKLVRCTRGAIRDVAVDIRHGSATFGHYVSIDLSADNWTQVWIPPGFAHGFVTLEPGSEVLYKVTDYYNAACDRGIAWNDPDVGVDWGLPEGELILSAKDQQHPRLADMAPAFHYAGKLSSEVAEVGCGS